MGRVDPLKAFSARAERGNANEGEHELAEELARLRAENERLREALDTLAQWVQNSPADAPWPDAVNDLDYALDKIDTTEELIAWLLDAEREGE